MLVERHWLLMAGGWEGKHRRHRQFVTGCLGRVKRPIGSKM
jgi:hypothetical protein